MAAESGTIAWRRDFDKGVNEAREQARNVLLDFSAAPV